MIKPVALVLAVHTYSAVHTAQVVMDIGAGTGILSLFAKQAGARKVFAVEASPLAETLKQIVELNDEKGVIEVIHGKAEEVVLPGGIKVGIAMT